ncbi:reverse transcriptase domain-containing protein [Mesorhizobium sp. M1142]|uniref:reverse transcriptase domain-containing protein n=1 Tax=Mesorhizobium sp. M1142 TaxID=2957060 RepID=UPI0033355B5C
MVAHRIADPRILRLIGLWLRAGVLESGEKQETDRGTPQGAGISPLLANIFLHYILDLWAHQWRRRHAHGRVVIVRYADDFVMGFEKKADAEEMLLALKARLAGFGLTLHEDKTRLIEFGRFAALSRQRRGERRPETFAFLGFTHYCGRTRDGRFIVKHKTEGKRLTRKLTALRQPGGSCTRQWLRSTGGSPPFCVDTTATTAGRTTTQRSTDSIGKCAGYGYGVGDGAARKAGAWAGRSSRP